MTPFADVDDLRSWLQEPDLDAAAATLALAAATAHIQGATGQTISAVAGDVVVFDGIDDQWLVLPQRPVTAVSAVAVNGVALAPGDWTLSGSRIYRYTGWNRVLTVGGWGRTPTLISVTYDHGYDPVPDDVVGAALGIAAELASNPDGLIAEDIDDYRRRWAESASPAAQMLLDGVVRRYGVRARSVRLSR